MNRRIDEYNARRKISKDRSSERRKRARSVAKEFKDKTAEEGRCRNPKCHRTSRYNKLSSHHIVHRSQFSPYDPERDSVANCMPLCFPCHSLYHQGKLETRRSWLSNEEVLFVIERKGRDWLDRIYPP